MVRLRSNAQGGDMVRLTIETVIINFADYDTGRILCAVGARGMGLARRAMVRPLT